MTPREEERGAGENRPGGGTQPNNPGTRDRNKEKRQDENRQGEGQGRPGQTGSSRTGTGGAGGSQRDTERRQNT